MTARSIRILFLSCVLCLLLHVRGSAQEPPAGTVTGQGSADVKRLPEILRIQVEVLAKGKDLKEALARLKERREAAQARLLALGAPKTAVVFGELGFT